MTAYGTEKQSPRLISVPTDLDVFKEGAHNGRGAWMVMESDSYAGIIGKPNGHPWRSPSDGRFWHEVWFTPEQCQELCDLIGSDEESSW